MNKSSDSDKIIAEYRNFLNIISHDFKSPIRHLETFIPMLIEAVGDDLNEEAKECVAFINQSLSRIKIMQNSLLTLSRVISAEEEFQIVESKLLIEEALKKLENLVNQYSPDIQYDNLPRINVSPIQFEAVFKNIIENAIIYHNDGTKRKIIISAENVEGKIIFTIQDNGIGIEKNHQKSVFDIFRRLHAEGTYGGGVGAGLAIAKAIINRHDGIIWMENTQDKSGTAVKFSLPTH